ncbi:MAG TPA: hypothetical protein VJS92_14675 [Candidatus Polarisedimenticolaceae bacterium]|nr:hypothetical protein [Candidatus Polarisedimenticolaceae bacterium]
MQRTRVVALGFGLAAALAGCQAPPAALRFPGEVAAERIGEIDPAGWGAPYAGGKLSDLLVAPSGELYVTTNQPAQVLRLTADGGLDWASAGDYVGPFLQLALKGDDLLVVDPGQGLVEELGRDGSSRVQARLAAAFDAASVRDRIFVYPNTEGYLLEVLDGGLKRLDSLVPLPGTPSQVSASACLLLPAPGGELFALWNPTRTLYRFGPDGSPRAQLALSPDDLLANLEKRNRRVQRAMRERGIAGRVDPYVDLTVDPAGHLAALYLFERFHEGEDVDQVDHPHEFDGAAYRFTAAGEGLDVIRGLGPINRLAFAGGERAYGLDQVTNKIAVYRLGAATPELAARR